MARMVPSPRRIRRAVVALMLVLVLSCMALAVTAQNLPQPTAPAVRAPAPAASEPFRPGTVAPAGNTSSSKNATATTKTEQYAGWTQVFDLKALDAFVTKGAPAKTTTTTATPPPTNANVTGNVTVPAPAPESYLTMRANRRIGYNKYSNGYIGGDEGYVREVGGLVDPTKLGVSEKLFVTFLGDPQSGLATVRDGNRRFWSYDAAKSIITWVTDEKLALQVQLFLKADTKDTLFFRAVGNDKEPDRFVSFRGALHESILVYTSGLTLVSLLTESSFFLAPSAKSKTTTTTTTLNAYNLKLRRTALEKQNGAAPSTAFIAYDFALAVLLERSFNEFAMPNSGIYDLYNLILTMAQVVVHDLGDEYEAKFPSLGKSLPGKIDLNEFALAINASPDTLMYVGITVAAQATETVRQGGKDVGAIKWGAFIGTVMAQAQLRGLDSNTFAFATKTVTYTEVLNQYYMHSCVLANLLPDLSILEKLKQTEMLYPRGSLDPYLEKGKDGQYWFESFTVLNITSFKAANILPELGLLNHLPSDFVAKNTMVGDGIATAITRDVTALIGKNDIKALALYASEDSFVAASSVAATVCQDASSESTTKLKFCVIPQILSQISGLAISDRSLFSSNVTTSVIPGIEMDLQEYMRQLIDKDLQDNVIQTLSDKKQEVITFLKNNMDKTASAIASATLEPMLISSSQVAKSQGALAEHLQSVSVFDRDSRVAQFEQKLVLLKKGTDTASGEKDNLLQSVKELSKRAIGEAAVNSVLDMFNTAISALNVFNPVTGFNPANLGDLIADSNQFSKSLTNLVQTTQLKNYVAGDIAQKLSSLFVRMLNANEDVKRVRDAVQPMLNAATNSLNATSLDQQAANFISVYGSYRPQVSQSEVEQIKALFTEIVEAFCVIIDIDGYAPCVTIPGSAVKVFGGLVESVGYSHEAINILFEVARSSVNLQSATQMQADAEKQQKASTDSVKALRANWDNNNKTRDEWWTQWKKDQSYSDAVSSIGLTMNQALLLSTVVSFCNYNAYENGGVPSDICASTVFAGKPISNEQIELLSSYKNSKAPSVVKLNAVIPTKPQYGKDTGFLDIAKLMDGESVTLQLPLNITWLQDHNWLPDAVTNLKSTVMYVKSFDLYLPPRFSTFQTKASNVAVEIKFSGTSSLGLALDGKSFEIPPSKFKNTYEERPTGVAGTCAQIKLATSDCNSLLPRICSTGGEVSDNSLLPSAFSTFEVKASFGKSSGSRIRYSNVTTPLFLAARVSLMVYTDVTKTVVNPSIEDLKEESASADGNNKTSKALKNEAITGSLLTKTTKVASSDAADTGEPAADSSSSSLSSADTEETSDASDVAARRLQATTAAPSTSKRCCAVGEYLDWASGTCVTCPEGSVSQLGGLYCVGLSAKDLRARAITSRSLRSRTNIGEAWW